MIEKIDASAIMSTLRSELDSLGVTTILMTLSDEFGIKLEAQDATPKNLKTLDSIVEMVKRKLEQ